MNSEYEQEILSRIPKQEDIENKHEMEFYGTPLLLVCEQQGSKEGKFLVCLFDK